MADDEIDDVGQTTPKGSGAAWQWRAIAQILPALLINGIRDNEQRSEPGESREEKPGGWQALLSGVLDRVATALARLESKLNAGPVIGEKQAAQQLGITPEAAREYAPFMGIPYKQADSGEVSFRENHLKFAYLPPEAGSTATTAALAGGDSGTIPAAGVALSGLADAPVVFQSAAPGEPSASPPSQPSPPVTGKDAAMAPGGISQMASRPDAPQSAETYRQEPLIRTTAPGHAASLDVARTAVPLPSTDPEMPSRGAGHAASMPPDNVAGMAIRGVENHSSVIHRLSMAAREAFSGGQASNATEQLSPGEAASVPAGAKVVVEVQNKTDGRPSGGEPADRRTFARRVMDRILPVSQEEREQARERGSDAAMPQSRPMQIRRAIRSLSVRGKRSLRSLNRTFQGLGKTRFGKSRLGSAALQVGQRGTAAAAQALGTVGRTASTVGTGAALSSATSMGGAAAGGMIVPVAGQVVAVGAALVAVVAGLKAFATGLAESNRKLGTYNGAIAAVNARLDATRLRNDIVLGQETQGTATELAEAIARMETNLGPFKADVLNSLNTIATFAAETVSSLGGLYNTAQDIAAEAIAMAIGGREAVEELRIKRAEDRLARQNAKSTGMGHKFAEYLMGITHDQKAAQLLQSVPEVKMPLHPTAQQKQTIDRINELRKRKGVQMRNPINPQWEERGF